MNRALQRNLEPLTAPPNLRLKQIARLTALRIPVQVTLAPLLPGLTDTRSNLTGIFESLASVGVRHVSAGYLVLRPTMHCFLTQALQAQGGDNSVLHTYGIARSTLTSHHSPTHRYLPKARRQRGYAALMALAADFGISVSVCGITNPDFQAPRKPAATSAPRRPVLFVMSGGQTASLRRG
jgi:DNA repair photolyase